MDLIAVIEEGEVAQRILAHLGFPTRGPPPGKPWRRQAQLALHPSAWAEGIDPPAVAD